MKQKKILIISTEHYKTLGGIQKYNEKLINIFSTEYDIFQYVFIKSENMDNNTFFCSEKDANNFKNGFKSKNIKNIVNYYRSVKNIRNTIQKHVLKNNYDLVIDTTNIHFNKIDKNKLVWVQHFSPNLIYYGNMTGLLAKAYSVFKFLLRIKNPFKHNKNIVLFDEANLTLVKNKIKKDTNIWLIKPSFNQSNTNTKITYDSTLPLTYCGRLNNNQKNIKLLNDVSGKLNLKINVWGNNDGLENYPNINHKGFYKEISECYANASGFILLSNYEGFPISLVEALSFGLPIFLRDTFPSASFFVKNKNGIIFNKDENYVEIAKKINEIMLDKDKMNEMSKNSLELYKDELEENVFENKWKEIIEKIII